jgi:serine/threonine protein kinase
MVARRQLDAAVAAALASEYRIVDVLGPGGLGNVFLAEDLRAGGRRVALKVFHRDLGRDPEFAPRLLERASAARAIRHPNVVATYDCGQTPDGTLYIAMELVEGPSLAERLASGPPLTPAEVVDIVAQCCAGLHAAHVAGVIHRHVKPQNVTLVRDGAGRVVAKLRDFSIAKVLETAAHTQIGCLVGTPSYMSYEQASGLPSDQLDGRADLYSLAAVAYEMLAGHPPFRGETAVACILKHVTEPPAPIRDSRPEVPERLEAAILQALAKDREARPATMPDFAAALRAAVPAPAPAPEPAAAFPPPWRRRIPVAAPEPAAAAS